MKLLSQEEKTKISEILIKKGVTFVCPMCSNIKFVIADGYFNHSMQSELKGMALGGSSIPTIALICSSCGFTSQHALGVLGLLGEAKND